MQQYRRPGFLVLLVLLLVILVGSTATPTHSQTAMVYYPQTGHFLWGQFRAFFEQNGGVPRFGYPLTSQYIRNSDGTIVQYFERSRFELVAAPGGGTTVQLGNVGDDYVALNGFNFPPVEPFPSTATRRYFPETGHSLQGAFKAYWDATNGARYFGPPISEEVGVAFPDGQQRIGQYFRRARFELQPNGSVGLGLLGYALAPCQQRPPRPQGLPPSGAGVEGDDRHCDEPNKIVMGRVYPAVALPGARLAFEAINFEPGEEVSLWLNLPDKTIRPIDYQAIVAANGYVLIGFETRPDDPLGTWSIVGKGNESNRELLAPFTLTR